MIGSKCLRGISAAILTASFFTPAAVAQIIHGGGYYQDVVPGWGSCPSTPHKANNFFDLNCASKRVYGLFHYSGSYGLDPDGPTGPIEPHEVRQYDFTVADYYALKARVEVGAVVPDAFGNVTLALKSSATGAPIPDAQAIGFGETFWLDGVAALIAIQNGDYPVCHNKRLPVSCSATYKKMDGTWTACDSSSVIWGNPPQCTWAGPQPEAGYFIDGNYVASGGTSGAQGLLWRVLDLSQPNVCFQTEAMIEFDYLSMQLIVEMWEYYGGTASIGPIDPNSPLLNIQFELCGPPPVGVEVVTEPKLLGAEEATIGGGSGGGDAVGSLPAKRL